MEFKYRDLNGTVVTANLKEKVQYSDIVAFVICVVEQVIDNRGNYRPYMRPLAFDRCLLETYTDVNIEDADEIMNYASDTDLFDEIYTHIDEKQIDEINRYIDDAIDYEKHKSGMDRFAVGFYEGVELVKGLLDSKEIKKVIRNFSKIDYAEAIKAVSQKD